MSKFKMPERAAQAVQGWVEGGAASIGSAAAQKTLARTGGGKQARLTIDLPAELHARFKSTCALQQTRMVDEVTRFIEQWIQEHR